MGFKLKRITGALIGSPSIFGARDPLLDAIFDKRPKEAAAAGPEALPAAPTLPSAFEGVAPDLMQQVKRRRTRASLVLTGPGGAGLPRTATKTLLGE